MASYHRFSSVSPYTALMLSILHPGVWGAIGVNDPPLFIMWRYTRTTSYALTNLNNAPKDVNEYNSAARAMQIMWQLGTRFSPNPEAPLFYDQPIDAEGDWIPEVRDKWYDHDYSYPDTLTEHSETLKDLLSITIVVPTGGGNGPENITFINQLSAAGIEVTRLDMPGGHSDGLSERLIAMAEVTLNAMIGAEVWVSPRGKAAALWGEIKRGR